MKGKFILPFLLVLLVTILGSISYSDYEFEYIGKIMIKNQVETGTIDGIKFGEKLYVNYEDLSKYSNSRVIYNEEMKILEVENNNAQGVYEGQYKDGVFSGKGKLELPNGNVYTGMFESGVQNGEGTMYFREGGIYKGDWKNGKMHGKGVYHWTNGDMYVGSFKNGFKDGSGSLYYKNGDKYVGGFSYNFFDSRGKYTFKNGNYYDGMWSYSLYNGEGLLVEGSRKQMGIWSNGQFLERKLLNQMTIDFD